MRHLKKSKWRAALEARDSGRIKDHITESGRDQWKIRFALSTDTKVHVTLAAIRDTNNEYKITTEMKS